MIDPPKVSIVIPVYNGSNYLRKAIDSALAQTYQNKEIIVVNDGSNDGGLTEQIALSYADKIRYFSKANGGVASALNKAIVEMTGEYFSWLSHDDLYFPDKIAAQIEALKTVNLPQKVVLYSDYALFQDNETTYQEIRLPDTPPEKFRYYLTKVSAVHGCTLLIPKQALIQSKGFNESLRYIQDYDLWFRMASEYAFVHVPRCLVKGRQHSDQDSQKMRTAALAEVDQMHICFIQNLSQAELRLESDNNSLSSAYLKLAISLRQTFKNKAAGFALGLALKNFSIKSISEIQPFILPLLKAFVVTNTLFLKAYPRLLKMRHWQKRIIKKLFGLI